VCFALQRSTCKAGSSLCQVQLLKTWARVPGRKCKQVPLGGFHADDCVLREIVREAVPPQNTEWLDFNEFVRHAMKAKRVKTSRTLNFTRP
jgi:hypothetical protein